MRSFWNKQTAEQVIFPKRTNPPCGPVSLGTMSLAEVLIMDIADRLRDALETRGNLSAIAKEAAVGHSVILKIASGKTKNPGIQTVAKIERAMESLGLFDPAARKEVASGA